MQNIQSVAMAKREFEITKFLKSSKEKVINNRFVVKASILDTGAVRPSILIVVRDLLENNFKMKFFETEAAADNFIQLLMQT